MQLIVFFSQNNHLYPNPTDKVLFLLSLCTKGAPAQFTKLLLLDAAKNKGKWGTFKKFMEKLETLFRDPNEE